MRVRILGCGTSAGVPRIDGYWGRCNPDNPKNRRRRVSILVQSRAANVIVDTSPDLREQLLDARINRLDAVFYTHDHADHTHGIDDLRGIYYAQQRRQIDVYGDAATFGTLMQRFGYVFEGAPDYPPIARKHLVRGVEPVGDMTVRAFRQIHGPIDSLGYRFECDGAAAAYSTDLSDLPEESFDHLEGLDLWVIDALRIEPHPTHLTLDLALGWIARFRPRRAILTHMNWDMDYDQLCAELPEGVEPGFDGLEIDLPA